MIVYHDWIQQYTGWQHHDALWNRICHNAFAVHQICDASVLVLSNEPILHCSVPIPGTLSIEIMEFAEAHNMSVAEILLACAETVFENFGGGYQA